MLRRSLRSRSWSDPNLNGAARGVEQRWLARGAAALVLSGLCLWGKPAASRSVDDLAPSPALQSPAPKVDYSSGVSADAASARRAFGLMFDLGTLDGAMLSLVYRPAPWLRVHAGGGTNGAGPGIRAGAAIPVWKGWGVSMEGGHFFPGNLNGVFSAFAGADYDDSHLLENFDYNFANLQLGWEVEKNDLSFFVRAGVGYVWSQVPPEGLSRIENLSSLVDADGSVEVLVPSLKLGFIGFL